MIDKRNLLGKRIYTYQGETIPINIYEKKIGSGVTLIASYGTIEVYISSNVTTDLIDKMVLQGVKKYHKRIFNRPFYKENEYIYVLGKKKKITIDGFYKNNSNYFYIKPTQDVLTIYKNNFLKYLNLRMSQLGSIMNHDLYDYKIRSNIYLSYFGCCFPTKKEFKFDYRLYAYRPDILDSVLIHEIVHLDVLNHSKDFYNEVYKFCPNYDLYDDFIKEGRFDGK